MAENGCKCLEDGYRELNEFICRNQGQPSNLIAVLHKIQDSLGFVPYDLQVKVADTLGVPLSEVYGVISFYAFFSLKPKGKYHFSVCNGTACFVRGAPKVLDAIGKELGIEPGDTTMDGKFSLEVVYCLGCCGLSPVINVNKTVYGRLKKEQVPTIISSCE